MFGTSWRVARIAGIEIRIDSSWAVIALLITYSMYLRASNLYPELSGAGAVGVGILATVLLDAANSEAPLPGKPLPTQSRLTDPFHYPEPSKP